MNKRRLLKLADLLEADANNPKGIKFDLDTWGQSGPKEPSVSCGTTACAMGLAALSGAFKRAGLTFEVDDVGGVSEPEHYIYVHFDGEDGIEAGAKLFGISQEAAEWLFLPENYTGKTKGKRGELAVAKRIRAFVAGDDKPPVDLPSRRGIEIDWL